tara:strand:+ start:233 stop:436 length:204 start_codon:yes stop_codon:yes gene_type:complete
MSKSGEVAHNRIDSHEKLCRIMQKQTHDKITDLQSQVTRIERILIGIAGGVIIGLCTLVFSLLNSPM